MNVTKFLKRMAASAAVVTALFTGAFVTDARAQTPDEIQARGKILVAMDLGSPPYAFTDVNQTPMGFDVDVARKLAEDMGVAFEIIPTNGQGRIPSLLTGKADVVIATFAYTPDRAQVVDYSDPYAPNLSVIFAEKGVKIESLDDLIGKSVGVARGTTPDLQLTKTIPPGVNIVRFEDDAASIAALASGQIDTLATADNRFLTLEERFPGRFAITLEINRFYFGIGHRKGNPELTAWLNTWVAANIENGFLAERFEHWVKQPLPELPKLSEVTFD